MFYCTLILLAVGAIFFVKQCAKSTASAFIERCVDKHVRHGCVMELVHKFRQMRYTVIKKCVRTQATVVLGHVRYFTNCYLTKDFCELISELIIQIFYSISLFH